MWNAILFQLLITSTFSLFMPDVGAMDQEMPG